MTIIHELQDPFPHLIIENMYDDQELELIWEELNFLNKPNKLSEPKDYGALHLHTKSRGIILDSAYRDRNISNILSVNRKTFDYTETYAQLNPHYIKFKTSNKDITKLRYYHDGESYDPHIDANFDTLACTYFNKEPKRFSGGELYFPDYQYQVPCDNNLCVIFPAYFSHGVREIEISDDDYFAGYGRYCMSQFAHTVEQSKDKSKSA